MLAKFITLDGIDGAGKTTQLNVIRDWFAAQARRHAAGRGVARFAAQP